MIILHLSEEELQMISSGQPIADPVKTAHLQTCVVCREQLELYTVMVSGIGQQSKPAFDFDLAESVLQHIQAAPAKKRYFNLEVIVIVFLAAIPLFLFRKNIWLMTTGISVVFLVMSLAICLIVLGVNIYNLYTTYKTKIRKLNLSE